MSGQYVRKQYPTNNYLESLAVYFERRLDTAFEGPDGAGSVETDICADIAKKIRSLKTHGASSTHRQGPETIPAMYTGDDITVIGKLIITDENRQQYLIAAVKEWQTTFKVEPLLDVLRELIIKSDASKVAMSVGAGGGGIYQTTAGV